MRRKGPEIVSRASRLDARDDADGQLRAGV
jgi:hypothetical protein